MKRSLTKLITKEMNTQTTMKHSRSHKHKMITNEYYKKIYSLKFDNEMDKFLDRHNVPKLTQEEINNVNRPISIKEIELIIDSLLNRNDRWIH